jgi:hypothetical protein
MNEGNPQTEHVELADLKNIDHENVELEDVNMNFDGDEEDG